MAYSLKWIVGGLGLLLMAFNLLSIHFQLQHRTRLPSGGSRSANEGRSRGGGIDSGLGGIRGRQHNQLHQPHVDGSREEPAGFGSGGDHAEEALAQVYPTMA